MDKLPLTPALKIMSLDTNQKPRRRQLTPRSLLGIELERQMLRSDQNLDQKNEKASEGLLKLYGSLKNNKRLLKAYQTFAEALMRRKFQSFGV